MKRHWRRMTLAAGLLGIAISSFGCGSGSGTSLGSNGSGPVRTASLAGRLTAPANVSLGGTEVVAEEVIGGRTATMRAILDAPNQARREALIGMANTRGRIETPGVYTATAMPDGSFVFRNLPVGEYSITARRGDLAGVLTQQQVGGARTTAISPVHLAAVGQIKGKVRYAQPNVDVPDNSGIVVFVKDTSFFGYSQGSSGDYIIPNVTTVSSSAVPYTVVAVAAGFADTAIPMVERLVGAEATAPLIFMQLGATLVGRVIDPTKTDPDDQGLDNVRIQAMTGQSTVSGIDNKGEGVFTLRGLPEGSNFLFADRESYQRLRQEIGGLQGGQTMYITLTLRRN